MPAGRLSRHMLCATLVDPLERLYLSDRVRYTYRELPDNRYHVVVEGDSLYTLAAVYFEGVERPAGLWWIIADFQPTPIFDPTIPLQVGRVITVPSLRTVLEEVLNTNRAAEFEG